MCNYLKNRKQSVQIINDFSSFRKVRAGVLQGSIDEPHLFNLFIDEIIFFWLKSSYVTTLMTTTLTA